MMHYERLMALIDLWVGLSLSMRLVLTALLGVITLAGWLVEGDLWLGPLILAGVVLAPLAFGAWRQ